MSSRMSSDTEKSYIEYSELSRTPDRNSAGTFKAHWKFLIILLICLTLTVVLQQCYVLDKINQRQGKEKIIIITTQSDFGNRKDVNQINFPEPEPETKYGDDWIGHGLPGEEIESKVNSGGVKCTPGTQNKQDCNTCTCTNDGTYACTKMFCGPNQVNLVH